MYAEFHSCGIFSPPNISSDMSLRRLITFFPPYLINSLGTPPELGGLFLFEGP